MAEETRKAKLLLGVETKGADKAAKSVQDLSDKIRKDLTGSLNDANKAASGLDIKASGGSSGGGTPAAAKFRGAASLVGGGEIVGLIDDLQDLGEGFSQLATQGGKLGGALVGTLSPAIGSTAAGVAVAGSAFAIAGIAIIALGAALAAFTAQQAKSQKIIEDIVKAQREVDEKINAGATTKELNEERELLIKNLEDEKVRVANLRALYEENIENNPGGGLAKLIDGTEEGLANSIKESEALLTSYDIQIKALTGGIEGGETAAADMAEAEEELAKTRDKEAASILKQAQLAGQSVAAQKRALGATEEANTERLQSIDDEKAAIEAQIAVLQSSGSTAESVTTEIEQLNAQLGNLGKESGFIKNTALEVSKARDAEKKATKDAEDARKKADQDAERNAERAADAQEKYNDAVKDAGVNLKQAAEDIDTKLSQNLADNLTGLFRDVDDIAEKFRRDTFDQDIKAQQAERDALIDHYRNIEDIQDDARKSEQEAIREGDFKQLFLARQSKQEALREEQQQVQREDADRRRAGDDERSDLLRNAQRERGDRLTAYARQNDDSRLAASRELAQAQLARNRSLAMAQEGYTAELRQLGQYLQARNQMQAQANQQALQQGIPGQGIPGGGIPGGGISGGGISGQGIPARMISQIIR